MITQLFEKGEIKEGELMDNYVTFMAGIFRSVRFGAASAHGNANMLRFNYFKQKGAFVRDSKTGKYKVQKEAFAKAVNDLSALILKLQGDGDKAGVEKLMNEKGLSVLPKTEEVESFRKRSEFLRLLGENFPCLEDDVLLSSLDKWLLPFLGNIRRISELKNLDLLSILRSMYSYQELQVLDKEAPESWEVPSGSKIKLEYKKDDVVLSVKIQELFGLLETPRIARGKVPLTLQLLSPSQRPIQVTRDIAGFWDRTYLEVKKELAGRYPRHPWPDNPRSAIATKFTKKRIIQT